MTAGVAARRALVTGASGFIGGHLVRRLHADGWYVAAVSRSRRQVAHVDTCAVVDLTDPTAVAEAVGAANPDVVFHLASAVTGARGIDAVWPTLMGNAVSTVAVLQAAVEAGVPRVVLAGSMEEYAAASGPPSPYAAAKLAAHTYADLFRSSFGIAVVHLRIFMVYGPGQEDRTKLVPAVAAALSRGEVPPLSSGRRRVDWVHVDDVVEALISAAVVEPAPDVPVDVGSGTATSIRDVVELIGRLTGVDPSEGFGRLPDRPRETEPVADVDTAQRLLRWQPTTPLEAGLAATVASYAQRG